MNAGGCEAKGQVWSCTALIVCGHSLQLAHVLRLTLLPDFLPGFWSLWRLSGLRKPGRVSNPRKDRGIIHNLLLFLAASVVTVENFSYWNNFLKKIILPFVHQHFLGFNGASILSFPAITNAKNSFKFHLHFFSVNMLIMHRLHKVHCVHRTQRYRDWTWHERDQMLAWHVRAISQSHKDFLRIKFCPSACLCATRKISFISWGLLHVLSTIYKTKQVVIARLESYSFVLIPTSSLCTILNHITICRVRP